MGIDMAYRWTSFPQCVWERTGSGWVSRPVTKPDVLRRKEWVDSRVIPLDHYNLGSSIKVGESNEDHNPV